MCHPNSHNHKTTQFKVTLTHHIQIIQCTTSLPIHYSSICVVVVADLENNYRGFSPPDGDTGVSLSHSPLAMQSPVPPSIGCVHNYFVSNHVAGV